MNYNLSHLPARGKLIGAYFSREFSLQKEFNLQPVQTKMMEAVRRSPAVKLELLHSFLHGLGIIFGLIGMPILISNAIKTNSSAGITGSIIYCCCFLMVFICSTLYHGFQRPGLKGVLKILDHISIYFLISGTYTPIVLIFVNNPFGMRLLAVLWGLTLLGIFFKIYFTGRFEIISTAIYLLMGMMLFTGGKTFFVSMPASVIALISAGGVLYIVGIVFYLWEKHKYNHAIWHVLVLSAAICHYAAVLIAVMPGAVT